MKEYTIDELAQMIDHTNLHTDASSKDMEKLCNEAKDYHFKMVAINQVQSHLCAKLLKGTDIHVGAAISFPLGQTTIASKVFDTNNAIEEGATEIDYVINQTEVKNKNWDYIKDEMTQIVDACHAHHIPCKVIFENCYLDNKEKIKLCEIAKEVKPDFIKTSTGFGTGGATFEDVALMKKYVGDEVEVKAAGGIRDANTFIKMIQNGATRIGTSAGVSIIEELKMIDQFHAMGRFVLKSVLENALSNFPNRPALQKIVAQALKEVVEESSPMEELMEEASKGDKKHFFNTIANWILKGPLFITKQLPKIKGRKFSPLSQVGLLYTKDDETFIPVFTKEENVLTTFSDEMGYYVEEVDPKELILEYEQKDFLDHPIVINPFNQAILLNDELYSYLLDKVHMEKKEKGENIIDIRPYIHKKHD